MIFFEKGRRGIRICLALALKYDAKIALHVKTIAIQVFGDVREVKDLCERLVREGYLLRDAKSAKSYRLALSPEQIKLGEIIRICEDNFEITDCAIAKACPVNEHCYFDKKLWGELKKQIIIMLNQITIQNYLDNMKEMSYVAPLNCHLSQLKEE